MCPPQVPSARMSSGQVCSPGKAPVREEEEEEELLDMFNLHGVHRGSGDLNKSFIRSRHTGHSGAL